VTACPGKPPVDEAALAELAAWYRREAARHRAAPRPAETRRRLDQACQVLDCAVDKLGELGPEDAAVAG
jgi:hypothetical protein